MPESELHARLEGQTAPAVVALMAPQRGLVPRFEADRGASSHDVALAKASALMPVQALARASKTSKPG